MLTALAFSLIAATTADADSASLLTEMITASLGKEQKLDVIASADVRRQLEVEANKQVLGCSAEQQSCLAEIANAMGARFVVYGKLGTLDDVIVLTLNLFDSEKAQAAGRVVVKDKGLSALSDKVDPAVTELTRQLIGTLGAGTRTRVLVLDVEAPKTASNAEATTLAAAAEPASALFWAGVGGIVGGTVASVVGVAAFVFASQANDTAKNPALRVDEAAVHYDERDRNGVIGFTGVSVGLAALVTGGVLLAMDMTEEPAEATAAAATPKAGE